MIKAVLFDLDGTLLPMDNDVFTKCYFGEIAKKFVPLGYDKDKLIEAIWYGTAGMIKNDGSKTNEEVFWDKFSEKLGKNVLEDKPLFDDFYNNEFNGTKRTCGFNPLAAEAVKLVHKKGFKTVLATSPIFPAKAVETRIEWSGNSVSDFDYYTTYENSVHGKPNPMYYSDIVSRLQLEPSECLMVGNDVDEDIIAASSAGLKTFLLTDNLINRKDADISEFNHGGFEELINYIDSL